MMNNDPKETMHTSKHKPCGNTEDRTLLTQIIQEARNYAVGQEGASWGEEGSEDRVWVRVCPGKGALCRTIESTISLLYLTAASLRDLSLQLFLKKKKSLAKYKLKVILITSPP